ncbi:MAG TPA: hypothetical protein VGV85_01070 [Longimicrobiaceae bacterium]|nr:hypothetical protein [Longimicrobiaceae bacterium]
MTLRTAAAAFLALPALLAACGGDPGESPERREARVAATRNSCVAEELTIRARENLANLDTLAAASGGITPGMQAIYQYATVYRGFAENRASALAYVDSAASARTPADSTRYARKAAQFGVRPAEPGTLDGNVAEEWQRSFDTARGNPAHFCNTSVGNGSEQ